MAKTGPRKFWILIDSHYGFPYRLVKDENNFMPQRMSGNGKDGEPIYITLGYYTKYGNALLKLAETVREDKTGWATANTLEDLARIVNNNHQVIKDIINDLNNQYQKL